MFLLMFCNVILLVLFEYKVCLDVVVMCMCVDDMVLLFVGCG